MLTAEDWSLLERRNHADDENSADRIYLPCVSRFERSDDDGEYPYRWKVADSHGLSDQGVGKSAGDAAQAAARILHREYVVFCERLAELEGLSFQPQGLI